MSTIADIPAKAGPKEWLGLAVLALPTLLLSIDVSVLHLAVPHISEALNPSASQMLWIIDIYGFLIAGFLVTMGTLGDRIGRRKLLLIGAAAFGLASVAAAYADDPALLIAARALLGVAGATLMPSTLALISNMFADARQRGMAIAIWVTMFSVGIALGPVVGGAMLEYFWWGSVFLLGVPIMGLLLVAGPVLLPEYRDENAGRLDLTSALLSLVAILPVIYGLKELAKDGLAVLPLLALVAGAALAVVFVHAAAHPGQPADGLPPLPQPDLPHRPRDPAAQHAGGGRDLPAGDPVPATGRRALPDDGGAVPAGVRRPSR